MKCNIVLHSQSRGGIIEKMAQRLCESLREGGVSAEVTDTWSAHADINHFAIFHYVSGSRETVNTMLVTHVDDPLKVQMVRNSLEIVDMAVCMSRATVRELVSEGLPREALCYVSPAHDGVMRPRRIVVGITSDLYGDGRKRENLLVRLANEIDLSNFQFEIFGNGWAHIADHLAAGGAAVRLVERSADYLADYLELQRSVPLFDFYLYTGLDEGSMGTVDALAAGVKTITTPQGFHLDLHGGITHPFREYTELRDIFQEISADRDARVASVSDWTWENYARKHVIVWKALLAGRRAELPQVLGQEILEDGNLPSAQGKGGRLQRLTRYAKLANRYRWNLVKLYYFPRMKAKVRTTLRRLVRP